MFIKFSVIYYCRIIQNSSSTEAYVCGVMWCYVVLCSHFLPEFIHQTFTDYFFHNNLCVQEKLEFVLFDCRSQFAFHLSSCPCKIVTFKVKGCNLMFHRGVWEDRMVSCALSHSVLYEGEIRRLRLQRSGQKVRNDKEYTLSHLRFDCKKVLLFLK